MLELIMNKYEEILIGTMEQAESTNSRRQGSMRTRTRERAQRGDFLWRLRNEELAKKEFSTLFASIKLQGRRIDQRQHFLAMNSIGGSVPTIN